VDDVDLHIYFGNPNEPYPQDYSGLRQSEFFDIDRAINDFMSVNIRKGSHMSNEQASQLEQAIASYFQGLFNNLDAQFNISVKDVLEGQAVGFHENDYSGDLQATLSKYTDEFFKNFTDELTQSILGYSIDYDTLKKFQQSGESISDTFSRVVGVLKEIPHAADLISEYMSQSGSDVVTAYNNLVKTWQDVNSITDTIFQNITTPTSAEDLKNQVIQNIRNQVSQAIVEAYMTDIKSEIRDYLLNKYGVTEWDKLIDNIKNGTISLSDFNQALEDLGIVIEGTEAKISQMNQQTAQINQPQTTNEQWNPYPFATTASGIFGTVSHYPQPTQTVQKLDSIIDELKKLNVDKGWESFKHDFISIINKSITEQIKSQYITEFAGRITEYLHDNTQFFDLDDFIRQIEAGNLTVSEATNTIQQINDVLEDNKDIYDELFISLVSIGEIDLSGILEKIPDVSRVLNDYVTSSNSSLVEAYEELVNQWDYINKLVTDAFQHIQFPFSNLKQQFLTNFKQNIGNQLIQGFYQSLSDQISGAIFSTYGIADYTQLANYLMDGTISIEAFNNALADIGNIIDQNSPKLEHLKQIFEDLGLLDDYYKQQYEQAKANYISALQSTISGLQQKQQQLEQNFQKAKQDYINALQAEINKKQEAANSAKNLIKTFEGLSKSLESYRDELIRTTLNPINYNYIRAQFLNLASRINTNNTDVLQETLKELPNTARIFLEISNKPCAYA